MLKAETLTLVMLIFAAILASSIIDQVVPRVSSPLIQIGLGLLIALFASSQIRVTLDPELFLVLFIAPLLYEEAKSADKAALWHHKRPVLSLAIGLVVATTLAIGFAVHAVIPSIGLAAAFALGAALGPTDAVAVTSLSKQVNIPDRQGEHSQRRASLKRRERHRVVPVRHCRRGDGVVLPSQCDGEFLR